MFIPWGGVQGLEGVIYPQYEPNTKEREATVEQVHTSMALQLIPLGPGPR